MTSTCFLPRFIFFPWCGFRYTEVQSFSIFPKWLPHHVTYDIIIIIKTFYMSSHSNDENFVSIRQAIAEKNDSSVRTNKQPNKQTNRQMKNHSEWQLGKTVQSRMALGRVHTSARWNSSRFLSHWWAGCEPKSNPLGFWHLFNTSTLFCHNSSTTIWDIMIYLVFKPFL